MAGEVKANFANKTKPSHRKPELIHRIEGYESSVNAAKIIPGEDGVISVSDDSTAFVFDKSYVIKYIQHLERLEYGCVEILDNFGQAYVIHFRASTLDYDPMTRRFFAGLSNGSIEEYELSEDFNKATFRRSYLAHRGRLTDVKFSLTCEWVVSTAKDKYFQWHCSETGGRLGAYALAAQCLCLVFDETSKMAFVGDYSGRITVLKLEDTTCKLVTTLDGHTGSVQDLTWDVERSLLFSASFDNSIICWDIGGQKGVAYDLNGHRDKVQSVCYCPMYKCLISAANDSSLVLWDMAAKRSETPKWASSNSCMRCEKPFFWNVKQMWNEKTLGLRQHHCRKCGAAICDECSKQKSVYPPMGFEYPVRMCTSCAESVTSDDQVPLASIHDTKHRVVYMDVDEARKKLLTIGSDMLMKIWDLSPIV